MQIQGRFKHLGKEDILRIQGMVAEDWNNLLRKIGEVSAGPLQFEYNGTGL